MSALGWSPAALDYFAGHGIAPGVAAQAGVTEDSGALVLPWPGEEGRSSWRRRSLGGGSTWQQEAGVSHGVWWPVGEPSPGETGTVLVCEGGPDALAAWSVATTSPGETAVLLADNLLVVAAVASASMPAERLVAALTAAGVANVVLALDGDDAGRKVWAAVRAAVFRPGGFVVRPTLRVRDPHAAVALPRGARGCGRTR